MFTHCGKGPVGEGDLLLGIEPANALRLVLDHVAIFPLRSLHQPRQFLDTPGQLRNFIIPRHIQLHWQALRIFLVLDLAHQQLDAREDGPIHDEKDQQQGDTSGHCETGQHQTRHILAGFVERPTPGNHHLSGAEAKRRFHQAAGNFTHGNAIRLALSRRCG